MQLRESGNGMLSMPEIAEGLPADSEKQRPDRLCPIWRKCMEDIFRKHAIHLDNMRLRYHFTEEEFCDGICSTRQYRRYLSGESTLSQKKIAQFCQKMGISSADFFHAFIENDRNEFNEVHDLYKALSAHDFFTVIDAYPPLKKRMFMNFQNERFLEFCYIKAKYRAKHVNRQETYDQLSNLIDYPDCLEAESCDFVDIIVLALLAEIELELGNPQALNHLTECLVNDKVVRIGYESRTILPSVYGNVCVFLGRLNKYNESLDIADKGLALSKLYHDNSALTMLRYMRAYDLYSLGRTQEAEIEAAKCLASAIAVENPREIDVYLKTMKNDFKADPYSFLVKYKKALLKIES